MTVPNKRRLDPSTAPTSIFPEPVGDVNDTEFVNEFLQYLSDSITWANENHDKAGEYANEIGVTTDAKVIAKSLDRANLKYIPTKDMIEDYNNYYQKLFDFDAKTVGGKLPDAAIYFTGK